MKKKDRRNYCLNRCYNAYYNEMPDVFKNYYILRYPGLIMSVLSYPELFRIQNLTPERLDVMISAFHPIDKKTVYVDANELIYSLRVYDELIYSLDEIRFTGYNIFAYNDLENTLKDVLRLSKIKTKVIEVSGNRLPSSAVISVL